MIRRIFDVRPVHLATLAALVVLAGTSSAQAPAPGILNAAQASKLLPASVYFDGQTASTQLRNSAGVRFADGQLMLAVLVDSSGYSSSVAQKYQGYLSTGVPLNLGGQQLGPGAYGMGVVQGRLYVMDIGNHALFAAPATHDATLHRPVPLQILAGAQAGTYRLCLGRECIEFHQAQ